MTRTLDYLRRHALAALALVCSLLSLAGASYAALSLPAGSVGTRQLRNGAVTPSKLANGSITPDKFKSDIIGGSIRHWASVSQEGHAVSGSPGVRVTGGGPVYHVNWGTRFSSKCAALVTPAGSAGAAPIADSTGVAVTQPATSRGATVVYVWTYASGTLTTAPFYLAVIC
jgi:hypothetical protein